MPPLLPLSQSADIGLDSTDEEVVMCLERIVSGTSLPPNVINEVNPFNELPWNLPEDMWYFFNSEGHKAAENGYWKVSKDDHTIFTNSTTTGSRSTFEYYMGQAPRGRKTNWVMHEYKINQLQHTEVNKFLDSSSLSRVFLDYGQSLNGGEQCSSAAGAQDSNGKMADSQNSTSRSKVLNRKEGSLAITEEPVEHERPDHPVQSRNEFNNFPREDFLELLDLHIPDSPSSSENSTSSTLSSDEYFDSWALLEEIEAAEHNQEMQLKHTDNKFQVSAPLQLSRVVHEAESLGFSAGNGIRSLQSGEKLIMDSSLPGLAVDQLFPNCKNSNNELCLISAGGINQEQRVSNQDAKALSLQGIGTDRAVEKGKNVAARTDRAVEKGKNVAARTDRAVEKGKSVAARIRKLRKKYLCFMPF